MSEFANYCNLKDMDWINIPGVNFIMKYKFSEEGYSILVTNLKEIFGESINEDQIQQRFSDLNVHAKMKTSVIMRNLERSLGMDLTRDDFIFKLERFKECMRFQVQFNVTRASLTFNFEPCLLSFHELRTHILVPTLFHALLTYQENIALKKRLNQWENKQKLESVSKSKDILLDYKMNLNAISLMNNSNVSDAVIVDSFLNVQRDIQACSGERKKVMELQKNQLSESLDKSEMPIKKEISESLFPIQYDEDKEELDREGPVKREISDSGSEGPNEENIAQTSHQASSSTNLTKTKKKKSFKF